MKTSSLTSRRSFIKTLGAASAGAPFMSHHLMAQAPDHVLRHASFGAGGMAWEDLTQIARNPGVEVVAICDVDLNQTASARQQFPKARIYQDWRELLDKEANNIDSVNVSTPDHMHASIGISAMQLGKHIYGQKPLAHNIHEVRRMTEMAGEAGVVTQMGIQIHSTSYYRQAVRIIQDGVIGKIKEVHSWSPKSWGDPSDKPDRTDAIPEGLDWNLWLGVCEDRPFIGENYYHTQNWRKRLDFGTGTFGDMGCHIFDPVFSSLKLADPLTVRSEGSKPNAWNWAIDSKIHYVFSGTEYTHEKTLPVTWYDGAQRPPAEVLAILGGRTLPQQGNIFIGTAGVMLLPHVGKAVLFPGEKFQDFVPPKVEDLNHWSEFVAACKGSAKTSTPFAYGGPLTEAVLLGGIASHFPQTTLEWNAKQMEFNLPEATRFIRKGYRKGWEIKGVS